MPAAGIPVYWLINLPQRQLELCTEPSGSTPPLGYLRTTILRPGDEVPLIVEGREIARIAVSNLLPDASLPPSP